MKVCPGDLQAAGSEGFVAIALAHGGGCELNFVVAELPFKGACGVVVVDADDVLVLQVGRQAV